MKNIDPAFAILVGRPHTVDTALILRRTYVLSWSHRCEGSFCRMISLLVHDFETPGLKPAVKYQGDVENPEVSRPLRFHLNVLTPIKRVQTKMSTEGAEM